MKKLTTNIKVVITEIKVDPEGYYSIKYSAVVDGKKKKGSYDSDFDGQSAEEFKRVLLNGYALEQALSDLLGF